MSLSNKQTELEPKVPINRDERALAIMKDIRASLTQKPLIRERRPGRREVQLSDFEVHEQIGNGAFGFVYRATLSNPKEQFAMKVIPTAML